MIYLNNAATSYPKPNTVLEAVKRLIENPPPAHGRGSSGGEDPVMLCRRELASLLHTEQTEQIIITSGATEATNLVLKGMALSGKHVITTATEHNSVIRPLTHLQEEIDLEVDYLPCDQYGKVQARDFEKAIKDNTALIVVNHVSNVTGVIQDIEKIAKIAHNNHIDLVIDASQSIGLIDINIIKLKPAAVVFTGHKGLFGLQGIGGLWLSPKLSLKPLKTGGTGTRSVVLHQPQVMPVRYEAGTKNMAGVVSMLEGIKFVKSCGCESLYEHKQNMISRILKNISGHKLIKCYLPEETIPAVLSFRIKNMSNKDVIFVLEESFGIVARSGLHCAPLIHKYLGTEQGGTIRLSPSIFTTEQEIDTASDALLQITQIGEMI